MTVLTACQEATRELLASRTVSAAITATAEFETELRRLAKAAAADIAKSHDWRLLTTLKTHAGDDSTTAFSLPTDYDRMPLKASVYTTDTNKPLMKVDDLDAWLEQTLTSMVGAVGAWTLLGGYIQIVNGSGSAIATGVSAKYYYISSYHVADSSSTAKATFTADSDTFRLSEDLLTLAIIWRWRNMKGLEYAEQMRNFEVLKAQLISRDKGSRILKVGAARMPDDAEVAYPWAVNA